MAATPISDAPIAALKTLLRDEFVDIKSGHIDEALACSLGFRTYAAMRSAMVGAEIDRPYRLLREERFRERIVQLGYADDPELNFELTISCSQPLFGVISTFPISAYEVEYKTVRQAAWRNLMVSTINAGLERRLFTLRPDDNRFGDSRGDGCLFDFSLPNGLPVRGCVTDAGHGELAIHAAVNPKNDNLRAYNAGFYAGDAFGVTWLERQNGAWMQSSDNMFNCRRVLVETLAELKVEPQGFGDRGGVII